MLLVNPFKFQFFLNRQSFTLSDSIGEDNHS